MNFNTYMLTTIFADELYRESLILGEVAKLHRLEKILTELKTDVIEYDDYDNDMALYVISYLSRRTEKKIIRMIQRTRITKEMEKYKELLNVLSEHVEFHKKKKRL